MNPLRGSCVSERSRCGAVRIFHVADEPSAEIMRVGSLLLWRRANFLRRRRTLYGDRACRIALWRRANLHACRRTLCGDYASRIALAVAPCKFSTSPTNPLRGSCVSDRSVAPCEFARLPTNPLRGSCVSERSRCGAVRICTLADAPSAGIVRVGSLSLWFS